MKGVVVLIGSSIHWAWFSNNRKNFLPALTESIKILCLPTNSLNCLYCLATMASTDLYGSNFCLDGGKVSLIDRRNVVASYGVLIWRAALLFRFPFLAIDGDTCVNAWTLAFDSSLLSTISGEARMGKGLSTGPTNSCSCVGVVELGPTSLMGSSAPTSLLGSSSTSFVACTPISSSFAPCPSSSSFATCAWS